MSLADLRNRPFIDETLRLVGGALGVQRLVFYGVDRERNLRDYVVRGVPASMHQHYLRRMVTFDPLHIRRIAGHAGPLVRWRDAARYAPPEHVRIYARFLRHYGVVDSLELMFRDGEAIVAGLTVAWTERDVSPETGTLALATQLQRYIEFSLASRLGATRASWLEAVRAHGLTPREREVAQLVCRGHTNQAVATCLGIAPSTVKTHLLRIFEKCGVDSRAGLVACLSDLAH
ncbi:MAG TPA: LuxR C-terminal-related transcriptional regulator [Polyangiales bacterium]